MIHSPRFRLGGMSGWAREGDARRVCPRDVREGRRWAHVRRWRQRVRLAPFVRMTSAYQPNDFFSKRSSVPLPSSLRST